MQTYAGKAHAFHIRLDHLDKYIRNHAQANGPET
jgi:hypothetical protein